MNKLTCVLVLGVFASCCLLAWAMLALVLDVRDAGRALPGYANLCLSLRPLLLALPVVATAYCVWKWIRKGEDIALRTRFVVATMGALILFVLPAMGASYLTMVDLLRWVLGA